jgi:hypothetical protein
VGRISGYCILLHRAAATACAHQASNNPQSRYLVQCCLCRLQGHSPLSFPQTQRNRRLARVLLVHPVEKRPKWQRLRPEVIGSGNPKSAEGGKVGRPLSRPPKIEPFVVVVTEKEATFVKISIIKSWLRLQRRRVQWTGPVGAQFYGRPKDNMIIFTKNRVYGVRTNQMTYFWYFSMQLYLGSSRT